MNIINLGILAHIDEENFLTKNLLFACGATEKRGSVIKATPQQLTTQNERVHHRASTTFLIVWNGVKCNIIDTPGYIWTLLRKWSGHSKCLMEQSTDPQRKAYKRRQSCCSGTLQKLQIPTIRLINKLTRLPAARI